MRATLPRVICPSPVRRLGQRLHGSIAAARLARVRSLLREERGEIGFELDFSAEGGDAWRVRGHLRAGLVMTCQRCLEPVEVAIDAGFAWRLCLPGARAPEPEDDFEPIELGVDAAIDVAELIEDELLLDLPAYPMHSPEGCASAGQHGPVGPSRPNPFAILASMRGSRAD